MGVISKSEARKKRRKRVRNKIRGTSERPRLTVFRREATGKALPLLVSILHRGLRRRE